jgi:hypothetical protein
MKVRPDREAGAEEMSQSRPVKKKAVSGSIDPRWPKSKVVRWLEFGAILAIIGLWWPDWLGAYGGGARVCLTPALPSFPPLLSYVGAVILLIACYQGIKDMGFHFKGVIVAGALCLAAAVASIAAQLLGLANLSLLFTGLAAVFAVGFLWFTIGKVAEITQERRTHVTWWAVLVLTGLTATVYLTGLYLFATGAAVGFAVMRAAIVLLTVTFALCRYGVHCYKTQTSIGAGFHEDPDNQYWAPARTGE